MQVKVVALIKNHEVFPSDKHLTALRKLRTVLDITEFSSVKLKVGFSNCFLENDNYIALVDEIDYPGVVKALKTKGESVRILKYGNDIDEFVNSNVKTLNNVQTYKLFSVNTAILDSFLVNCGFNYQIENLDGDVKVQIDFADATDVEKDVFIKSFLTEFGDKIYAYNDVLPEKLLVDILSVRNMNISVAESFTGGNLSSLITSVSGASKVFYEGIVCYNENSKSNRVNVSVESLLKYKPVSKQVAYEMCKGLLDSGNADIAVSTTGIAGPNSDDSEFPVGLCYIGVGTQEKITVYKFNFKGSRSDITAQGVKTAICLAVLNLK